MRRNDRKKICTLHTDGMSVRRIGAILSAIAEVYPESGQPETHQTLDGLVVTIPNWRDK